MREKIECEMCEGEGELIVSLHPEHGPKCRKCPECNGSGKVYHNSGMSPGEYEQDMYESYLEQKWEAENDR